MSGVHVDVNKQPASHKKVNSSHLMLDFDEADLVQLDDYVPDRQSELVADMYGAPSKRRRSSRSRRRKKNTVSFKYDMKLAKIEKKDEGWSSWWSGVFGGQSKGVSIKDLAYVQHVPKQEDIDRKEYHTSVEAGQTACIQFQVFNHTENDWDAGCMLINDYDGGK